MRNSQSKASSRGRASRLAPAERRRTLLESGVRALSENRIGKAVHADLAKIAGVSTPTVFHYFPSREVLIKEVLDEVAGMIRGHIISIVDAESESPGEALLDSGRAIVDFALDHPQCAKVWMMWSTLYDPAYRPAYLQVEKEFVAVCAKLLSRLEEAGQDKEYIPDRARLIFAAGQMLMQLALDNPDKRRIELYVQHVMRGLLTASQEPVNVLSVDS
jgi:TetR/AcrR family hemagglutinin/protease transcriptional regulator